MGPKQAPRGPGVRPRAAKRALEHRKMRTQKWTCFWTLFGWVLEPSWAPKLSPRTLQNWSQNGTRKRVPTLTCQDGPKMVGSGPVNTPTQAPLRTCTLKRLSQTSKIPKGIVVGHIYANQHLSQYQARAICVQVSMPNTKWFC